MGDNQPVKTNFRKKSSSEDESIKKLEKSQKLSES